MVTFRSSRGLKICGVERWEFRGFMEKMGLVFCWKVAHVIQVEGKGEVIQARSSLNRMLIFHH